MEGSGRGRTHLVARVLGARLHLAARLLPGLGEDVADDAGAFGGAGGGAWGG